MNRISIDVTAEQHQRLRSLATQHGMSVEAFVLARSLAEDAEEELGDLLQRRLERATTEGVSNRRVEEIFDDARKAAGSDGA